MSLRTTVVLAALPAAAFLMGATLFSQPPPQDPGMPALTEHHKAMAASAGIWDAEMTFIQRPGAEPMTGTGVETNTVVCNGMWSTSTFKGVFGGMPFEGRGLSGYDSVKGKYVSVWVDSMSDSMSMGEGEMGADGKTLTMINEARNPETGKVEKTKMVEEHPGPGKRVLTMFNRTPDGEWFQSAVIRYKKRSQ